MQENKKLALCIAVALIIGFAFGKWSKPSRVETVKETVNIDKKSKENETNVSTDTEKSKNKTTTEIIKPDGTTIRRTKYIEHTEKSVDKSSKSKEESEKENRAKEVTIVENSAGLTIGALAGTNVKGFSLNNQISYGGFVHKTVLGPIGVGAFGLSNGTCGLSLGLSF